MSCTNVLLQCLDSESRCIFILGTMFKLDSRIAGDILGLTGSIPKETFQDTQQSGRFPRSLLRRIWTGDMQVQRQAQLCHKESPSGPGQASIYGGK